MPHTSTGKIDLNFGSDTFETWYKVVGDLKYGVRPIIALHGGPGVSHSYMLPHVELFTTHNIPIIFYDQIGIGQSSHCPDKPAAFWSLDLFKDELDNVLAHFGIADDFDLIGHSWGGMLAADYAATRHPAGLKHIVLTNSLASMELWEKGTQALLQGLPEDLRDMLKKHESDGTTADPEYQLGMQVFYKKHVCTLDPWPAQLLDSFSAMAKDPTVYRIMLGSSEFNITGSLKTWSVIDKLHTIISPTLIINSPNDEAQDICVAPFYQKIPKVKWVQLANSTHTPFFEEEQRYFQVLGDFLTGV